MKRKIRKNQVVIAALAVMLAVAGYISFDRAREDKPVVGTENSTEWDDIVWESEDDTTNPGESVLTGGGVVTSANYATSVKLSRDKLRASNKETLLSVINNAELSDEQKKAAVDSLAKMTERTEMELAAEILLTAKGFNSVVVTIGEDTCDVVVDMGEVTDAKRAQIEDVIKRKCQVPGEKIIITPITVSNQLTEE
ncbi:MAG: SpoIIIAH-like family protein [Agathobacter sp.]|nr:SpoIIIAH-like family protein [Agathobacter sp.]